MVIYAAKKLGIDSNGKGIYYIEVEADSFANLPSADQFESDVGALIAAGSKGHTIDTNGHYMIDSSGTWVLQDGGTASYTKAEVDALLSGKEDTLTFDNTPTSGSQNPVTSGGIYTAISGFITMDEIYGQGTAIVSTTANPGDLNDYKIPGKYYGWNAVTNSLLHLPIANTSTNIGMIVLKITDSNVLQFVKFASTTYDKYIYFRRYAQGTDTWQPWYYIEGVQV